MTANGRILERQSQSHDLKSSKMLLDLKRVVESRQAKNMHELKQFCME